jgi:multiple antibiotic resistance protein
VNWFDVRLFGEVLVTLFVIMDPPGIIPIFLSLGGGRALKVQRRMARQAAAVSLGVITAFALFGRQILNYLNIGVPALQVSGGLLLLLVALELLTGKADEPAPTKDVNVALVPLGTPLLAGPGAIVATIVFVGRIRDTADALAVGAGIVAVHLILWFTMRFSVVIIRLIKESGVVLVTRIAGLLLSAIAVQLVAEGIRAFVTSG